VFIPKFTQRNIAKYCLKTPKVIDGIQQNKGNNYARPYTGYQPLFCVFCIYNTVFRSLPVNQKLPASA
jgi:hypothetical protein